jgi:hypothetical protein
MKKIFETEVGGLKIRMFQDAGMTYAVAYGSQLKQTLTDVEAAHEFGECLMHALQCDGKLDN